MKNIISKLRQLNIGLKVKVIVPMMILITFALLLSTTIIQVKMQKGLIDVCKEQTNSTVKIAATKVNPDYVKTMTKGSEGSPIHTKLKEKLSEMSTTSNIADIYCITKNKEGQFQYAFDLSEESTIGTLIDYDIEMIEAAFAGSLVTSSDIDKFGDSYVITAYHPLVDSTGRISSVMGVDYDVTNIQKYMTSQRNQTTVRTILFVVFNVSVIYLILSTVVRDIKKVGTKIAEIAGTEGDLTQKIDVKANDEIGLVSSNLNLLLEKLNAMVCSINDNITAIRKSSEEINSGCITTSDGVSTTSASMEEIAATMEVVGDTVKSIEQSFVTVMRVSDQIALDSTAGAENVDAIVNRVQEEFEQSIKSKEEAIRYSREISETVEQRIEDAKIVKEIEALTSTVLDIASQTNLLSLNASIEAARAGQAGRGFAVVATEIGKLSEQSADAAKQIQAISERVIKAVTSLTNETKKLIEFSEDVTDTGYTKLSNLAEDYKTNVTQISEDLKGFAKVSGDVYTDMLAVKDSIDIVVMSVEECNTAITSVNVAVEEIVNASAAVKESSDVNVNKLDDLAGFVNTFKFENNRG